ncbi:unnamed protein product [Owenia fusiformis]|uniref:Uncharacterized protein n=1 Tax=Owenia fusiformis TaxID=6347 RepID=A0A8J1V1J4_OWEFU|nr:unnamed protein product [Owenia fusiformis]
MVKQRPNIWHGHVETEAGTGDTLADDDDVTQRTNAIGANETEPLIPKRNDDQPIKCIDLCTLLTLIFIFIGRGLCLDSLGPTLLDLIQISGTDISVSSYIFICQSTGILFGSLVSPYIYGRFREGTGMFIVLLLQGCCTAIVPLFRNFIVMCCLFLGQGIGIGITGVGVCQICLKLGGQRYSGTFLQAVYFGVSVGGIIGPLMAEPFLSHKVNLTESILEVPWNLSTNNTNAVIERETQTKSNVLWFYIIVGCIVALPGIPSLCLQYAIRLRGDQNNLDDMDANDEKPAEPEATCATYVLLVLLSMFVVLYYGMQDSLANLLTAFAVNSKLQLPKSTGNLLCSIFWFSSAASRLFGILFAGRFSALSMLTVDLTLSVVAGVTMSFFGDSSPEVLLAFVIMFGISWATINGAIVFWASDHILPSMYNVRVVFVSRCLGLMIAPSIVANLFDLLGPMVLMYTIALISITISVIFIIMQIIYWKYIKRN